MRVRQTFRNVLVVWLAIFQMTHLAKHNFGEVKFVPKVVGFIQHGLEWSAEHDAFFHAMTVGDLVTSLLSIVFIVGYFLERHWAATVGVVCLTLTVYSGLIYDYGFVASGAWRDHERRFWYINIGFLPIVILYVNLHWLNYHYLICIRSSSMILMSNVAAIPDFERICSGTTLRESIDIS